MLLLAAAGVIVLILAAGLWRFAPTATGQALSFPLTVVGGLFLIAGVIGYVGTDARLDAFAATYAADPAAFVQAEIQRVARFQRLYTATVIGASAAFTGAVLIFALSEHPGLRAVAVCLVLVGLTGLVIDMFSQERANRYVAALEFARVGTTPSPAAISVRPPRSPSPFRD